ncbi:MAG TPA: hypothetical protein VF590_05345 [Isosphaeraceae bacterium]|jgi:hypothetical protein
MKLLSTKTHGVLDYLTAGAMLTLPRAMGWGEAATRLLTGAGLGALGYSLLTRYELGLVKVLPMRAHLSLDALSGAMLCAAPLLLADETPEVKGTLVGLGLFEIAAAMATEAEPAATAAPDPLGEAAAALRRSLAAGRPSGT